MANQYNDQPRHRHRDTQHDQFEARNDGQYGEGSDHDGSRERDGRFDERGYGRSDDRYEGDYGRSRQDPTDTRSYTQDRDRLRGGPRENDFHQGPERGGGRFYSDRDRYDEDARWGTMEGRSWGGRARRNPDPVPDMDRSARGYSDYGGSGYRDDDYRARGYEGRGYGGRGRRVRRGGRDDDRGFFDKAGDEISSWFGDDDAERRRRQDHRGRGPANYSRSNERLMEDACERLTHDPRIDARQITVTAKDNEITLDGHVASRSEKREAEDCVHEISGVKHVQNNLRIGDLDDRSDTDRSNTAKVSRT